MHLWCFFEVNSIQLILYTWRQSEHFKLCQFDDFVEPTVYTKSFHWDNLKCSDWRHVEKLNAVHRQQTFIRINVHFGINITEYGFAITDTHTIITMKT